MLNYFGVGHAQDPPYPSLLVLSLCVGFAQSNFATVSGSVLDPQRYPVPGVHVHVMDDGTGELRYATSDTSGLYQIAALKPGCITLMASTPGFKQITESVRLEVGQQAALDLQLLVGDDRQTVTVSEAGDLLKTQDTSVGDVVEKRSVSSLPLNGRMLIDLVLTMPACHMSFGAAAGNLSAL